MSSAVIVKYGPWRWQPRRQVTGQWAQRSASSNKRIARWKNSFGDHLHNYPDCGDN